MNDPFYQPNDATPLTPDETDGLIPTHVMTRDELNALEQENILAAEQWVWQRRRDVLSESFLKRLHKRMYKNVWRWAGDYRQTDKNIGVKVWFIQSELHNAIEDAKYQIEQKTFSSDEIAVRFHHRLVAIHPFSNGNGRWSRLAADLLIRNLGDERFSWGSKNLQIVSETRAAYISALRAADNYDIEPLLLFARA